ncbi:phosphate/phosphite/phosphonate ABC transporter substrate-binding protein [Desulfogranum mediterraneum]|uniref:phosphate/phosphite/phosphonate ABC transporter substrate-binding protein n=1 Tax=Desulfogranum mediterraneum TaxID=160661 RepID=UPI001377B2D9|nr:phosphate/phosphite/phosphonate ABC transporter substrate-binding protein [Desulfogranum mediterraneum]
MALLLVGLLLFSASLPPAALGAAVPGPHLKVAIIPHRSNLGNEQAYGRLFKALEEKTGLIFDWVGSNSYDDVIDKITSGEADIGYVGPFAYVTAQARGGVRLICRTLSKNRQPFYHSVIVTRKDSGIHHLKELKGQRFAFTDPKSTSGYLFPMAQLKKSGLSQADFSSVHYLKRHANSLLAVYQGHVDGGATSLTAADKVDIDLSEIRTLWQSEPIYRGPWIARRDLPDEQFRLIQEAMLSLSQPGQTEQSPDLFAGLTTKGFVPGQDSDYDNVREVIRLMDMKMGGE